MNQHWDELASAYLDGEATADEAARVEASAEGLAALADLRRIADANASVTPPTEAIRVRHLDAALNLFDDLHGVVSSTDTSSTDISSTDISSPTVVPIRRTRSSTWLAAAAAGVVVVAGIGLGLSRLGDSATGTETADGAASSASSQQAEAQAGADGNQDDVGSAMAARASEPDAASDEAESAQADPESDALDESADTFTAPTTASPEEVDPTQGNVEPVTELTSADDLFAVADALNADGLMSFDPATAAGQQLLALQVRCPEPFEAFIDPLAAPVRFDGTLGALIISTSSGRRAMVITWECDVLIADQQP